MDRVSNDTWDEIELYGNRSCGANLYVWCNWIKWIKGSFLLEKNTAVIERSSSAKRYQI